MRKVLIVLVVATLLLAVSAEAAFASGQIVHRVKRGENLYQIARRYGTSVQAIASANGIRNPNYIYAGQRLVIPSHYGGGGYTGGSGGSWYRVRRGDTLSSIAWRYGTTVYALQKANHLRNPNCIYAGQKLYIPAGSSRGGGCYSCGGGFWYKVQWGDTLSAIGWRYGVSPWAIASANHLRNLNCIYAGQKLWIPG